MKSIKTELFHYEHCGALLWILRSFTMNTAVFAMKSQILISKYPLFHSESYILYLRKNISEVYVMNDIEKTALNSVHIANVISERIRIEKNMALTLSQKKMVLYLASLIQEEDTELQEVTVSIADYFRLMGMDYSGGYKKELEKSLINICSKCFWLPLKNGQYKVMCRWLDKAIIDYEHGELHLKLDETLKPYFIQLSGQARTIFQLGYVLKFKYKYTPDVYMFASRCRNLNVPYAMPIADALKRFGEGKYKDFSNLKKWVLDNAVSEINEKSDLTVRFNPVKNGRKITHIAFMVFKKTGQALEEANDWKKELVKKKSFNDEVRELFEDDIIDDAIDRGYLDYSDPDSINAFSADDFLEWKEHVSKKSYAKEVHKNEI